MAETSTITLARRTQLRKITSGVISTLPPISHIAFGTGGVDSTGKPIPPSETQQELTQEIARYPIDSVTAPIETTARYTVTIPKNELIGEKISEAALVDEHGTLCAIKTMFVKQKDDGVIFTFTFDDEF